VLSGITFDRVLPTEGREDGMTLSAHEQRMLDQIDRPLSLAEDPKY